MTPARVLLLLGYLHLENKARRKQARLARSRRKFQEGAKERRKERDRQWKAYIAEQQKHGFHMDIVSPERTPKNLKNVTPGEKSNYQKQAEFSDEISLRLFDILNVPFTVKNH